MKNHNFIIPLIAAAGILVGCIEGNDIHPEDGVLTKIGISFVITDTDEDTKALEVTTENITSFEATAMYAGSESQYFGSLNFTGSGSPKKFTSSSSPLWPKGSSLDFYAYSTGSATGQVSKSNYKTFTVTPASSAAAQVDFVYACGKDQNINTLVDGCTQLNFLHTQSKVTVKVKNPSSKYKAVITGWRLGYLDESGTFTHDGSSTASISAFDPSCWTNNTSPSALNTYTMDLSESPVSVAASVMNAISLAGEMIVVPQSTPIATNYATSNSGAKVNGSYVALKIKLMDDSSSNVLYGGEDGEWAIWPVAFKWFPGQQYSYTINIGKSGYQESNPSNETIELASMFPAPPKIYSFGGVMIAPAPLYYNGSTFVIKDDDWNHESWGSASGNTSGSYYFSFKDIGPFFSSTGSWTSSTNSNIDNLGNKVSYGGYNDWRVPTPAEWQTIIGTSRAGSTVNGNTSKHYSFIRLTGVTHAGNSSPYGVLLFPDNEMITGVTLNGFDNTTITSNITNDQLNDYLNQGCAFLPASGWRYRSSGSWERGGQNTYYWSTAKNSNTTAQALRIATSGGTSLTFSTSVNCSTNGYYVPVRLVRTAE